MVKCLFIIISILFLIAILFFLVDFSDNFKNGSPIDMSYIATSIIIIIIAICFIVMGIKIL